MGSTITYKEIEFNEKEDNGYNFVVKTKVFNWNPKDRFWGIFKHYSNNPLLTFSLGIVFTALIAWYFYRKTIRTKNIKYKELLDHTIINEKPSEQTIKLSLGSENFSCASLYKFVFKGEGHSRIYNELIREPLTLSLSNIKKILDLKSKSKGTGWKLPSIQGDKNIVINFDHIDPDDWLELTIIASQEYEDKPPEVVPHVTGSISETKLIEEKDRIGSFLTAYEMTLGLVFVVIGPLILLDIYFDFMPEWWRQLFVTIFPVMWGVCLLYYFASKMGRRRVIETAKITYYLLRDLLPKRSQKG